MVISKTPKLDGDAISHLESFWRFRENFLHLVTHPHRIVLVWVVGIFGVTDVTLLVLLTWPFPANIPETNEVSPGLKIG